MVQRRTRHRAEFKAKVALAALTESKTLAPTPSEYGVDPAQLTCWKQELENAADVFGKGKTKEVDHDTEVAELYRQIVDRHRTLSAAGQGRII
jgi:transposase